MAKEEGIARAVVTVVAGLLAGTELQLGSGMSSVTGLSSVM